VVNPCDQVARDEENYVVFRHMTASSFTLTALPQPSTMGTARAPVNGIQIVYPSGYRAVVDGPEMVAPATAGVKGRRSA
jgi:hypothetical protein